MPRSEGEWIDPHPGDLMYHLKWTHGVWVSSSSKYHELEHIHTQLHGPKPEGWVDPNGTWDPSHTHDWTTPESTTEIEGSWEW